MSITYPTSLDTLTTGIGTTGQPLSAPNHITQHTNESLAIQALEVKVGIDSSGDTSSIDYKLKSTSSSNPGHKHTLSSLSDFNVSSPTSGQFLVYNGSQWANSSPNVKFGGTGTDGALTISSGTTTIDCANAAQIVKNYTSISITGTGKLAFSNPHANGTIVTLKSQGAVTLTSSQAPMIDMSSMGAATGGANTAGVDANCLFGKVAGATLGQNAGKSVLSLLASTPLVVSKNILIGCGSSGSGGQTLGAGGVGGGALIIECGGAFNFTTASGISVKGGDGTAASGGSTNSSGGGGGSVLILYTTLTANSGTITVTGGAPGTGGGGAAGATGSTGYSLVAFNAEFA